MGKSLRGTAKERKEYFNKILREIDYHRILEERRKVDCPPSDRVSLFLLLDRYYNPKKSMLEEEDDKYAEQRLVILRQSEEWFEKYWGNVAVVSGKKILEIVSTPHRASEYAKNHNLDHDKTLIFLI